MIDLLNRPFIPGMSEEAYKARIVAIAYKVAGVFGYAIEDIPEYQDLHTKLSKVWTTHDVTMTEKHTVFDYIYKGKPEFTGAIMMLPMMHFMMVECGVHTITIDRIGPSHKLTT